MESMEIYSKFNKRNVNYLNTIFNKYKSLKNIWLRLFHLFPLSIYS